MSVPKTATYIFSAFDEVKIRLDFTGDSLGLAPHTHQEETRAINTHFRRIRAELNDTK